MGKRRRKPEENKGEKGKKLILQKGKRAEGLRPQPKKRRKK